MPNGPTFSELTDQLKHTVNYLDLTAKEIQNLANEAKDVFKHLDLAAKEIRDFEKMLNDVNAYFPFRQVVLEEKESPPKSPEERHKVYRVILAYRTKVCWYLAWEEEDNAKNFRLFLIAEEKEMVIFADGSNHEEFQYSRLSKRPLIATDLATRFKFCRYLNFFIGSFKEHLHQYLESVIIGFSKGSY